MMATAARPRIPLDGLILGFGPMLPLVAAGIGVWTLPLGWKVFAVRCTVVWGALILSFIGGVRRGYGFGRREASTAAEIVAAIAYFTFAGLALVVVGAALALALLAIGFALAILLDLRAARRGDAPAYFARLRPPQLLLGVAGLTSCWLWLVH